MCDFQKSVDIMTLDNIFLPVLIAVGMVRGLLQCYDCTDTFKYVWNPFTACQVNVSAVPVATCLDIDRYCKVERVSLKGVTVSITRGCADECYHGCQLSKFGATQLQCTSCCNYSRCNVGSAASSLSQAPGCVWPLFVILTIINF